MSRVAFRRFSSFLHIRGGVTISRLVADYVIPLSHSSRLPLPLILFLLCQVLLVVLCISLFPLNKCFFTRTSRTYEDFKRTTASMLVKALRTIQKAISAKIASMQPLQCVASPFCSIKYALILGKFSSRLKEVKVSWGKGLQERVKCGVMNKCANSYKKAFKQNQHDGLQ